MTSVNYEKEHRLVILHGRRQTGLGTQMYDNLRLWLHCQLTNNIYIHNTMSSDVDHNYEEDPLYGEKVDRFFNIYQDELIYDHDNPNGIDPLPTESLKPLCDPFIHGWRTAEYNMYRAKILRRYNLTEKPQLRFKKNKLNVAIHIRRGDILRDEHFNRVLPDEYYIESMYRISEWFSRRKNDIKFYIFSQSPRTTRPCYMRDIKNVEQYSYYDDKDIFGKFKAIKNLDYELVIDNDIFSDFHHMKNADVLVMSRSCLSRLAAIYSSGVVFYCDSATPGFSHEMKFKPRWAMPFPRDMDNIVTCFSGTTKEVYYSDEIYNK